MDRAELKRSLRAVVGLASDDPLASDEVLNPIINQAYQDVVALIADAAPGALMDSDTVTLTAHVGTLPAAVHQLKAVREDDQDGADLLRCPWEELPYISGGYAVTGLTGAFTITVNDDVTATILYVAFTQTAGDNDLDDDADTPTLVPTAYHDVIYLTAAFAAGLAGEQRVPPAIEARRMDRTARLLDHLGRVAGPGASSRTRMVAGQGDWP